MNITKVARPVITITSLAAISIALSACSSGIALPGAPTPEPTPVYVTAPLTGVKYMDDSPQAAILKQPSVACKIDNGSEAPRPQAGLNSTDMVFDEMVEGGLTRIVAIWHSNKPDAIGPVRSIRPMDPDILSPFGGIVCYSGGQQIFVNLIEHAPVFTASETSEQGKGTFSRSKDRIAPHNVIVNVSKLATDHPDLTPPPAQFAFADDAAKSSAAVTAAAGTATSVKSMQINFPSATALWTASKDGSQWLRTQDGKPLTDKLDGEQIHATNVVVMQVKIDRSYADRKYGHIPKTVMIDTGKAWVYSPGAEGAGSMVEATWSKASATSPIALADAAGAPILLAPGNTWVELMPVAPEGKLTTTPAAPAPAASPKASK